MRDQSAGIHLVAGDLQGLSVSATEGGILTKAQARLRGRSLDLGLSKGEDPASSPVLTRRAAWLTSRKNRHALARSIRRLLDPPSGRRPGPSAAVPPHRGELAGARMLLARVAALLEIDEPVYARGVARLQLLLSEGGSALYAPHRTGELRCEVDGILDALEGREETW
jgi:hypothetical protein